MKISDEYHGCCSPLCQTWDVLPRLSFAEAHIFFLDKAPRLSIQALKRYKQERSGKVTLHCIGCICWTFLCVFKCFEAAGTLRRYLQAGDFRSAEIYSQRREGLTQRLLLAAVNQIYNILLTRSIVYNTVTQIDNTLHYCCRPDRTMYILYNTVYNTDRTRSW